MTENQFKTYEKINNEIRSLEGLMAVCGKKYKKMEGLYPIRIMIKGINKLLLSYFGCGIISEDEYTISPALQKRIVDTIEKYIDEKKLEMENL